MKRILFLAIVAFLAGNLGLYGQEKDTAQIEPKVKLELVWEKEFGSPVVDFAIENDKQDESYVSVVIIGGEVLIINKKGTITKELSGIEKKLGKGEVSNIFRLSESGTYIIQLWGYAYDGETKESRAYVYDLKGNLLWQTKNIAPFQFRYLAPNGEYFLGGSRSLTILWGDKKGNTKVIKRFDDSNADLTTGYTAFSGNSEYWATNYGLPWQGARLRVFKSNGIEKWHTYPAYHRGAGEVAISTKGKYVGAIGYEHGISTCTFFLFDISGQLLWEKRVDGTNYRILFPISDDFVALINAIGHINLFETLSGNLITEIRIPYDFSIYQDISASIPMIPVSISKDGKYIAIGARRIITNEDYLFIIIDKSSLTQIPLGSSKGGYLPLPKFSKSEHTLFVARSDILTKFNLNEER